MLTSIRFILGSSVFLVGLITLSSFFFYRHQLKKVGPNQALIIYGKKGTTVVAGGAYFVNPFTEQFQVFSLELMSFDVAPAQDLYTFQGIAVRVSAVTQAKVQTSSQTSIRIAAEQFLSKSYEEREVLIRLVMEGHLRNVVGHLAIEDLVRNADYVASQMVTSVSPDLEKMGLVVVSFTIKDVQDKNNYITQLSRPHIEDLLKQTTIHAALAQRDTAISQAEAEREAAAAKARTEQERMKLETDVLLFRAELQRTLGLKKATFDAEVKSRQAEADTAYDLQTALLQQQLVNARAQVQEREHELLLLEAEAQAQAIRIRGDAEGETSMKKAAQRDYHQAVQQSSSVFDPVRGDEHPVAGDIPKELTHSQ